MAHGKTKRRWASRILVLLCLLLAGVGVYNYLAPTLTARSVTEYVAYPVESRDLSTAMSFGGTVSILYSEAVSASEGGTVREVYVTSSQSVQKGDKLLQLEDGTVLTAGIQGVVNQLRVSAGRYLPANMTLVQICDLVHMQISMNVDEYDISNVHIGQPCTVYILPLNMTFETEIAHINRVSASSGTVAYYAVGVELTVPEEVLPGMQASVTIPQSAVTGVPALPVEALSFDEDGGAFVYRKTGEDTYEQAAVTLGLNDGMYAQLLDGLAVGEIAYASRVVETVGEGLNLSALYKQVFGETVVITEGERSRGGRGAGSGTTLPEGAAEGGMPQGFPEGSTPEGATAGSTPEGATEGSTPQGFPNSATNGDAATVTANTIDSANTTDAVNTTDSANTTGATDKTDPANITNTMDAANTANVTTEPNATSFGAAGQPGGGDTPPTGAEGQGTRPGAGREGE